MVTDNSTFTALGGKKTKLQFKNYTADEITFAASPADPTADQVVEQFNTADPQGMSAKTIEDSGVTKVMFYSEAEGDAEYFKFLEPSADSGHTILGVSEDYTYWGYNPYYNYDTEVPDVELPDPEGIMDDLSITRSSVRAFLNLSGTTLQEAKRDE